jgi:hypothetical protein
MAYDDPGLWTVENWVSNKVACFKISKNLLGRIQKFRSTNLGHSVSELYLPNAGIIY